MKCSGAPCDQATSFGCQLLARVVSATFEHATAFPGNFDEYFQYDYSEEFAVAEGSR